MSTWALRENLKRPQDPALKPGFDEVLTLPSHVDNCDQGEAGNDFWGFNSLGYGVLYKVELRCSDGFSGVRVWCFVGLGFLKV